jgi:hypothetical protein
MNHPDQQGSEEYKDFLNIEPAMIIRSLRSELSKKDEEIKQLKEFVQEVSTILWLGPDATTSQRLNYYMDAIDGFRDKARKLLEK